MVSKDDILAKMEVLKFKSDEPYFGIAYSLKKQNDKELFMGICRKRLTTSERIDHLKRLMLNNVKCAKLDGIAMEWLEEYRLCLSNNGADIKNKPSFDAIIQYSEKNKLKIRLHELIDGKSGKDVGVVLVRAKTIDNFLTRFPTKKEYESEFELIGSWKGISNYFYKDDNTTLGSANSIIIFDSN